MWLAAFAATCIVLTPAQRGAAQIAMTVTSIEGAGGTRDEAVEIQLGMNAADCEVPTETEITIRPMDGTVATVAFVDLWRGTNCNAVEARTAATQTCDYVGTADIDSTLFNFSVSLDQILMGTRTGSAACETGPREGQSIELFAFTTGVPMDVGDVGGNWGTVSLKIDATLPLAPTIDASMRELGGDGSVTVNWDEVEDTSPNYRIYADTTVSSCSDTSTQFIPGEVPPNPDDYEIETPQNADDATVSLTDLGLGFDDNALLFIAAVDFANNVGVLSQPVCVTRIPTTGFCDTFEAMGGEPCPDGCAVGGPVDERSVWLTALVIACLVRRRNQSEAKRSNP